VEVALEKIRRKFSVGLEMTLPKVPYRETITGTSQSEYVHKKQTGGHGQYARVEISLEPRERGTGFEFVKKIVGGAIPRTYIPSVEKGVVEALKEGVLAHYPLTDLRVTLVDGREHPVDSSDIAFKIAGSMALKKGAADARPVILEPIMSMAITVPDSFTGDIIGDLNAKRGRVGGMDSFGSMRVVSAEVPLAEIQHYTIDLRSMTGGRGTFELEPSHYEHAPPQEAQKVIAAAEKDD
jgi:elongation factor G